MLYSDICQNIVFYSTFIEVEMASLRNSILNYKYIKTNANNLNHVLNRSMNHAFPFCTNVTTVALDPIPKKQTIGKAMKAYMERSRELNDFMKLKNHEFQIGKRHLANIMGENPETFTQKDIDNAIEYLFPSGVYDKKARPMMKSPEDVMPQRKAAEFDETGRPYHSMFYTSKPNFFQVLHDAAEHIHTLNAFEDVMIRKQLTPDPNLIIETIGSAWFSKEALEQMLVEEITNIEYETFIYTMDRLVKLPYSYNSINFINKYRKQFLSKTKLSEIPQTQYDENGRNFITVYECARKSARGDVTIRSPGTGLISINGKDITFFDETQAREQILFPLIFTNLLQKVDIEANVEGGGPSGKAGAIRWGISMGLRSFVDQETIERMRIAGLLTRDFRRRERKKPGQEGARRKFTWKKR